MNREAQSVVLLLVGGAVLRISLSDVYLRYVKEGLRPFLIVSGVLLVVIAAVTLWRELFNRRAAHADGHDHHGHGGPKVAWLLILPVLAVFLIAPPALGSYAASREASTVNIPASDFPPLPSGDPVKLTVLDYATRAVWENGVSMQGRTIKLSGFLSERPGGGLYLTRIILTCCAADGRPIKVGLSGDVPGDLRPDQWVEVIGTYDPVTDSDAGRNENIPYLKIESLKEIPAPSQPYES